MERTRRRFWTLAISAGAVLVIVAAAVSGLFRLAVQSVPGYRSDIERYVREATGQNVRIGDLALTWQYYYPSLDLNGVALLGADGETPVLQAERLRLGFGLTRLLRGDLTPNRLELQGLGLNANIDRDGQVTVQGIAAGESGQGEALEGLRPLTRFAEVRLERCRLNLRDERRGDEVWSFGIERAALERGLIGDALSAELSLPASLGDSARFEVLFTGELLELSTWSGTASGDLTGLVVENWLAPVLVKRARVYAPNAELHFHSRLEGGRLQSAAIELKAGPVRAHRAQHAAVIESLELGAEIERIENGWRAALTQLALEGEEGFWPATTAEVRMTRAGDAPPVYEADVGYVRIADLAPWLQILAVPPELARLDQASGALQNLQARYQDDEEEPRYTYRAHFDDLALPAAEHPAGFSGLRGEVAGDERGGRAVLQESAVTLELPGRLVTPNVPLEALEAEIEWRRHGDNWVVGMPQFRWELWGVRGRGRLALTVPPEGGSPVIDLAAQFSATDVTRVKSLIPQAWGAGLRSWLDRSIVAGRAPRGEIVIQGPLADFPFHARPTGRWSLDIDAADAELAYHPAWPGISGVAAQLHFEGNSLAIEATKATVAGSPVQKATARFPDFSTGQLLIDGSVRGETARFYDFVSRSPVRETLKGLLTNTTASGPSTVTIHLDIPIKDAVHTQVSGEIDVDGVTLRQQGLPEPIRDVRGRIAFTGKGITAEGLTAQLYEAPVTGSIAPQPDGSSLLSAAVTATFDPAGKGPSELLPAWLRKQGEGASRWSATLPLGKGTDGRLRLSSDLVGVEMKYPAPLGKARDAARPLVVTIGSAAGAPLQITVESPGLLGADLRFARKRGALALDRGALRLGAGVPSATEPGMVLSGEWPQIDIGEWYGALQRAGLLGGQGETVRRAVLRFGVANWGAYAVRNVTCDWTASRTGWDLALSGPGGTGEARWTSADHGLLSARLEQLALFYIAPTGEPEDAPVDPNALPQFDLDVRRLSVGEANLGHVTFATARTELGQKTRALKADGGILTLMGEAEWRRRAGQSSATLSGDLATSNISALLRAFGYTPNLDAKAAHFKAALAWAPAGALEWARGEGTVHLEVENGQLRAVEPGAGRVLGLINFYALPRRLLLNFRDVLGSGLAFDKITGDFELRDGSAHTQNLRVAGPSVRMDVKGRVGLAARDYDQEVTVYPDVSGSVTLGAVLLGGPIAGALALIAQELFNKPLNQVSQLSYRVTGSWDNPQVTRGSTPAPEPPPAKRPKARRK
jgi:uncharacterized protein (TIGR02099 family)